MQIVDSRALSNSNLMSNTGRMEYTFLGKSGLKVSRLCLGTANFTESGEDPRTCSQDVANKILDRFVEAGGNFLDTADIYSVSTLELFFYLILSIRTEGQNPSLANGWRPKRDQR